MATPRPPQPSALGGRLALYLRLWLQRRPALSRQPPPPAPPSSARLLPTASPAGWLPCGTSIATSSADGG